jgi:hypothetical protein
MVISVPTVLKPSLAAQVFDQFLKKLTIKGLEFQKR